jgi:hypothetical protein
MRSLRFRQALELLRGVFKHERYHTQPDPSKEKWELFRLYGEFVNEEQVPIKTPSDFGALVPTLTPDKTGFNTSMIVLHILLLTQRKEFGNLRDRLEFVKGYRKRYLKGPENSQSSYFLRMMNLIETHDLNYKRITRSASKMLVELKRIEEEEVIQGERILPYSWIWNYLMMSLREYHPLSHSSQKK